ncbi:MAG: hypothetical protein ACR2PI_04555 [Hyphomicrobiaceae bacterium]
MTLNPLKSDVWERTGEGWTLKSKIGKAYAISGLKPEVDQPGCEPPPRKRPKLV